jgi:hypothetical protein
MSRLAPSLGLLRRAPSSPTAPAAPSLRRLRCGALPASPPPLSPHCTAFDEAAVSYACYSSRLVGCACVAVGQDGAAISQYRRVRCAISAPVLRRVSSRALRQPSSRCSKAALRGASSCSRPAIIIALPAPSAPGDTAARGASPRRASRPVCLLFAAARGAFVHRASRPALCCGSRRISAPSFSPSLRCVSSRAALRPSRFVARDTAELAHQQTRVVASPTSPLWLSLPSLRCVSPRASLSHGRPPPRRRGRGACLLFVALPALDDSPLRRMRRCVSSRAMSSQQPPARVLGCWALRACLRFVVVAPLVGASSLPAHARAASSPRHQSSPSRHSDVLCACVLSACACGQRLSRYAVA